MKTLLSATVIIVVKFLLQGLLLYSRELIGVIIALDCAVKHSSRDKYCVGESHVIELMGAEVRSPDICHIVE